MPVDPNQSITEWQDRNSETVDQLSQWLADASRHVDRETLDKTGPKIGAEVIDQIDCLDCGNCCKTSVTDFTKGDIKRAAKYLGMTPKGFIKDYLIEDVDGTFITITTPCPMLNGDNTCKIYEVRPKVCESYPHVHRDRFANRLKAHQANLDMCPISYHTIKRLKAMLSSLEE